MSHFPRILVVDDSAFDRHLLNGLLTAKGYEVVMLEGGVGVLEAVASLRPALILLDMVMPEIAGTDVLRLLRGTYSALELPIIMVTAQSESASVVEALALGANDYIVKPIDIEVTLRRVATHHQLSELSRAMGRLREVEAINTMIATYNHEINNPLTIAIWNLELMIERCGKSEESRRVEVALTRIADIVKQIRKAAAGDELQTASYAPRTSVLKFK